MPLSFPLAKDKSIKTVILKGLFIDAAFGSLLCIPQGESCRGLKVAKE